MRQEKYDAVVIGSGIGGMCAAALLSHNGYKTLVIEKLPAIGGRCATLEYKGYKLSTGAASVADEGWAADVFKEVGAEFDVVRETRSFLRIRGRDIPVPQRGLLPILIDNAAADQEEGKRVVNAIRRGMKWMPPSNKITFHDWLQQYTQNPRMMKTFQMLIACMYGVNAYELPAGAFFEGFKVSDSMKISSAPFSTLSYARNGNSALMESLAAVVLKKGGDVWTQCRAKSILVSDGVVQGATVQKGSDEIEITSKLVISNAGPKHTVELAGKNNFDLAYLALLEEDLRSAPDLSLYVGSDIPYAPILMLTEARRLNWVCCMTSACPNLAPPGKHLVAAYAVPRTAMGSINWQQEIDLCIQDLRDNLPGFDDHCEVLHVGCYSGEWPEMRTCPSHDMPHRTPIENLYNVGDAVVCLGTIGAARSAQIVVEDIKSREKPK